MFEIEIDNIKLNNFNFFPDLEFNDIIWDSQTLFSNTQCLILELQKYQYLNPIVVWIGTWQPKAVSLFLACCHLKLWMHPVDKEISEDLNLMNLNFNLVLFKSGEFSIFKKTNATNILNNTDLLKGSEIDYGLILKSSGTGNKGYKLCKLHFKMISSNAKIVSKIINPSKSTALLICSSIQHTSGWNTLILPYFINSLKNKKKLAKKIVLIDKFNPFKLIRLILENKEVLVHFTPVQAEILSRIKSWRNVSATIKNSTAIIGSTDVSSRLINKFNAANFNIIKNYGLTEVGPYVLYKKFQFADSLSEDTNDMGIFSSLINYKFTHIKKFTIFKELELSGDAVFLGYWNDKSPKWFKTGDAFYESSGKIYFAGRIDSLIKINDKEISPNIIEQMIINRFHEIKECVVSKEDSNKYLLRIQFSLFQRKFDFNYSDLLKFISSEISIRESDIKLIYINKVKRNLSGKVIRNDK